MLGTTTLAMVTVVVSDCHSGTGSGSPGGGESVGDGCTDDLMCWERPRLP